MIEIRERAELIVKNLAPLVGCKSNEKRWAPRTALEICKNLDIQALICMDIEKNKVLKGPIVYQYDNSVSVRAANIYKYAIAYSPIVLNPSYLIQVQGVDSRYARPEELLYMQSLSKKYNDSAIMDLLEDKKQLKYAPVYKHLLLLLLECFSVRYALFEFAVDGLELNRGDVETKQLDKLCSNLNYIKMKLEEYDADETSELNHHLSNLLLNLRAIKYDVSRYFLEI